MKTPSWLKQRIQRDPEEPLTSKEVLGAGLGICYLLIIGLICFRFLEAWVTPLPQDNALHHKCVLIASEIAKGSDTAYRAVHEMCLRGELK